MEIKAHKHLAVIGLFTVTTIVLYFWFIRSPYFVTFEAWSRHNLFIFYSVLLAAKITGIVWPPINGGLLTLGSIPIIGWWQAYVVDLIGSTIGSSLAYLIARQWGVTFIHKIFDRDTVQKILSVKIKAGREFEAVFLFRLLGGSLVEAISYGAGLLNVRFSKFLWGSLLSHALVGLPLYYFAEGLVSGRNVFINLVFISALAVVFLLAKKRYFEFAEL